MEPESGAMIVAYDLADTVDWQATGQSLTGTTTCNNGSSGSMTGIADFVYDARNRLKDTLYTGSSTPNVYRTYTADGLLNTVISDGSTWTYGYNTRRLPTTETLTLTGAAAGTWSITHGWNANGHESSLQFPDGSTVTYAPNGLGQATQVIDSMGGITYATGATYHPNGQIAGFTYSNGIVHSLTQTLRGLPSQSSDGTIVQDTYTWDQNANLTGLNDTRSAVFQVRTRSMSYDQRDGLHHEHDLDRSERGEPGAVDDDRWRGGELHLRRPRAAHAGGDGVGHEHALLHADGKLLLWENAPEDDH